MTKDLFIKIRNLTESWACMFVPLCKWEKKVQQSCPDLREHLTSIYALYEYRDAHYSIIIREMAGPNCRFLFKDYFHRTWQKNLQSLRSFTKSFCSNYISAQVIFLQKDLYQQETEYTLY